MEVFKNQIVRCEKLREAEKIIADAFLKTKQIIDLYDATDNDDQYYWIYELMDCIQEYLQPKLGPFR